MKVCQIQKDRDKQARCKCSILHFNIEFCDFSGIRGRRIGEASNPGPRLRRRGPRSVEARTERRQRREAPTTAGGSEGCEELNLTMLHLNLRGFLSHIAEVTAVIRDMPAKPFLVCLNETFLTKAVEEVKLEGYQVLARRDREGQWGGGVLMFVMDAYFARVTLVGISESAKRIWVIALRQGGITQFAAGIFRPIVGTQSPLDSMACAFCEGECGRETDGGDVSTIGASSIGEAAYSRQIFARRCFN